MGLGLTPTWGASGWTVPSTGHWSLWFSIRWTASGTRGARIRVERTGSGLHDLMDFSYDPLPPATGWGGSEQQGIGMNARLTSGWVVYFEAIQFTGGTRYVDEAFVSIQLTG